MLVITGVSCIKNIPNPVVGEVYIVHDTGLTTWKIIDIKDTEIYYIPNDYQVSEKQLIDSINNPENYTDTPIIISREDFQKKQNLQLLSLN